MAKLMKNLLPRAVKLDIILENLREIAESTLFCNGSNGSNGYVQQLVWSVSQSPMGDWDISCAELGSNSFLHDESDVLFTTRPEELDFLWEGVLEYDDDGELIAVTDADEFIVRDGDGEIDIYDTLKKCFEFQWSEHLCDQWKDIVEFALDDVHVEPTHTYRLVDVDVEDILDDEKYDDLEYNVSDGFVYANAQITEWEV